MSVTDPGATQIFGDPLPVTPRALRRRELRLRRRTKVCAECRDWFIGARKDSVYCSSACRQRAYRKRTADAAAKAIAEAQMFAEWRKDGVVW